MARHVSQVDTTTRTPHTAVASSAQLIIPVGTQVVSRVELRDAVGAVVCPLGAAGVVVRAPGDATHAYRVRLADGREVSLRRQALSIARHVQRDDLEAAGAALDEHALYEHVVYRCVLGSHAYGLRARLATEAERSTLPEAPTSVDAIKGLLRRIRVAAPTT